MNNAVSAEKIEEIKGKISERALVPEQTIVETHGDLAVIMKPYKNPYNLERLLKKPSKAADVDARLARSKKAILNIYKGNNNIKDLLLYQEFIACHAKDSTPFIVKITEFRESVKSMADISLMDICANRKYVKALADVSSFALAQLILYGRKYDLIAGTKNALSLNMFRFFMSTLKSKNVFTGINPKSGAEEIFIDADSYIHVCESKLSGVKAVLNAVFWMRNLVFYQLVLIIHRLNIISTSKE